MSLSPARCFVLCLGLLATVSSWVLGNAEKSYEDNTNRFRLRYPDSLAPTDPPKKSTLLFLTPKEVKPNAKMRASVQVKIESASALPGVSLDKVAAGFSKSMEKHGITIGSTTDATVGGRPAKRIEYAHSIKVGEADVGVKAFLYLFIVDDWTWSIDVRAPDAEAASFASIGESVVKSFEFTK